MMFVEVNRRVKQNIAFPDPYPGLNKDSDKASTGNGSFLSFSIEYKHYWMKIKEASSNNETGIIDGSRSIPNVLK